MTNTDSRIRAIDPSVGAVTKEHVVRFGSVTTSTLRIGFEEHGDPDRSTVVLLHGWPDDVRSWDGVAPALAEAGFHVVVPYLRGFGPTRFREEHTPRSGQISALTQDLFDLMDALRIERFMVVGHDWGARAAYLAAASRPDRIAACGALSVGWGTTSPDQQLSLKQTQNYWYHWLFALPRGEELVRSHRHELSEHIWRIWSPEVDPAAISAALAETSRAFDNPDWADVTLHSYRYRWGLAAADPAYEVLESMAKKLTTIDVPTLVLHGADDPCNAPETSEGRAALFRGEYRRVVLDGIGHFPQRTAAPQVCEELLPFLVGNRDSL
ncbi:alpha/beta fold hydrolase [Arthrobacter woluwensis]|uniref:alpha/beta fold hydrolase n=1 Tax=Arthrobacter woluwensis TaxID=156980 RepID=UPI0011A5CA54|nr:alpha/beta hydrolase [Arthrobacter woluwensis]